jgi:hypothetical protein
MGEAAVASNQTAEYSIEVRKADGTLKYREVSVAVPELPEQPKLACWDCIPQYRKAFIEWEKRCQGLLDYYEALREYHTARCKYCMKHGNDKIEVKYRTGEPYPRTVDEARKEINKIRRLE